MTTNKKILINTFTILCLFILVHGHSFGQIQTTTYTTAGASTWTAPACVTSVTVQCWGGGGGSGGDGRDPGGGTAGGGGAFNTSVIAVIPGTTYSLMVGAGGTAGTGPFGNPGSDGGNGGESWFLNNTTVMAVGGDGGITRNGVWGVLPGGLGGLASAGYGAGFNGGNGGSTNGINSNTCCGYTSGGGGGSSAGPTSNGNNGGDAPNVTKGAPGAGGIAVIGGGAGGAGTGNGGITNPGAAGQAPGGGAGGGQDHSPGNTGGTGQVTLIWVVTSSTGTISGTTTVCNGNPAPDITFTGANATSPYTFTYTINGGANQTISTTGGSSTVTLAAPTTTSGVFTYSLTTIGCGSASGSAAVTVNPLPTATINGTTTVCNGAIAPNITFTGANGTPPYTFTYSINGGADQTISTSVGNTVTIAVPTTTSVVYTYALVSVKDASSTGCSQVQTGMAVITINPLPTATIGGTVTVCQNSTANITFTGANGTAPYTFTYTINGGANQTISTTLGNSSTIVAPTTVSGTFTYSLVSVQDASSNTCSQAQTGTAQITVLPSPTGTISGTTSICNGTPAPNITFSGSGGTEPYMFIYMINSGADQTVSTTGGSSTITVAAPTTTSGVFTYSLVSIADALCSQSQTGSAIVTVSPLPTASISGTAIVCLNYTPLPNITFTGATGAAPYTFIYTINGGADQTISTTTGNTIALSASTSALGTNTYALVSIQDANNCSNTAGGSAIITVNPPPTATISGTTSVCNGSVSPNITFTGSAGTAPYTFTYTINDGANQTVSTSAGNSIMVAAPTSTSGTFKYMLTGVSDASGMTCGAAKDSAIITVIPLPTVNVAGTTAVCLNDPAPTVTFTGVIGAPPYTFTYTINGGAIQTISTTGGNSSVSVSAPTSTVGTYTYTTTEATSTSGCDNSVSQNAVITINPLPTATISGTTTICQNTPAPSITFMGANAIAPYTFTYAINGGANQTVSSTGGSNTVTIPVPTSIAGTYTYALVSVQDGSTTACSQAQTGNAIVTINPAPSAAIDGTTTVCNGTASPDITFTGSAGAIPYIFTYNINGGANQTVSTSGGNSTVTIAAPTTTPGIYIYALTGVQDANLSACGFASDTAIVTVNPLPTGIISGTTTVCAGSPSPSITFTGANAIAPYVFTYTLNGGGNQTVSSIGGSSIVTIAAPTTTAGTYTYALVSVQDASSTACSQTQAGNAVVTILPSPSATISGTTVVCNSSPSPNITFTGSNGTLPYIFTYTINGEAIQTISTSAGNSEVTLAVLTTASGIFPYSLTGVQDANLSACGIASGGAVITVNPLPTATISGTTTVCAGSSSPIITFTGANGTEPYTFTYTLNGGANQTIITTAGNSITVAVPTTISGTFTYALVSIQDASSTTCSQTQAGNAVITILPSPIATISGTTVVCNNSPSPNITFTGSNGTLPYIFTYNISGGVTQTISTIGANSTVTIAAPTSVSGTFTYSLTGIQDANLSTCGTASGNAVVTVNPLPTATLAGTGTVCQNSASPHITFTGANGTAPYTFIYTINGGANQMVVSVGNSATISAPTTTTGILTYALVSIQDASSTACSQLQTDTAIITINPLPIATINGTTIVCDGDPKPNITFTGTNGTAPYTFIYTINGGANQTVTTAGGSSVMIAVPTTAIGIVNYSLVSVQDASSTICSQTQVGSANITINPIPTATISGTTTICQNAVSPDVTFTGANGTAPYTFIYTLNGGAKQTISTTVGNSINISAPTTTAGTFMFSLVSVQDASATACSQAQVDSAIVTINPLPTASIKGTTDLCQNAPAPVLTFMGMNGTAPYIITYNINGGVSRIVTTNKGDSAIVIAPTNVAGAYTYSVVSVTDNSSSKCSEAQTGTAIVSVHQNPKASFTAQPEETTLLQPLVTTIDESTGANFWNWNFGDGTSFTSTLSQPETHTYADTGTYVIKLITTTQYGCIDSTYQTVIINEPFLFYIPNAFTPNGDGKNDTFTAKGEGFTTFEMMIFDRWGNLIFTSNDINKPWDGKANGGSQIAQIDTYVYVFQITDLQKHDHTFRGTVTLVK